MYDDLLPYRQKLTKNATKDEIAWIFLQAIYDLDEEIGIYYIFEPGQIKDPLCLSIVSKLSGLKLANKLGTEAGNKNYYMKIRDEGVFAIENFNSLDQYEKYLIDTNITKTTNSITIGGNVIASQIGQDCSFGDLRNKVTVDKTSDTVAKTIINKSNFDIKTILQYLAWLAGIASALLAYFKYYND